VTRIVLPQPPTGVDPATIYRRSGRGFVILMRNNDSARPEPGTRTEPWAYVEGQRFLIEP
jgi:hypothetical protein